MTVEPDRTFDNNQQRWKFFSSEKTGLAAVTLTDADTGVQLATTLPNPEKRVAAHRAWAAARHSRAEGDLINILAEMGEQGVDPDARLDEVFRGYGHASVGDLARVPVDIANVPMHVALAILNWGRVYGAQEKSTRFQKMFGSAELHDLSHYLPKLSDVQRDVLEPGYQALAEQAREIFTEHLPRVTEFFTGYFNPGTKREKGTVNARAFDTTRFSLLMGQRTGFIFDASARDWAKLIGVLRGSSFSFYQNLGSQLETFLAPEKETEEALGFRAEVPTLIRHTEANTTATRNLGNLRDFLEEDEDFNETFQPNRDFQGYKRQSVTHVPTHFSAPERMVAQYVLSIWPSLDEERLLEWVSSAPDGVKARISGIICADHTRHDELPQLAATTNDTYILKSQLGELRDWNRHRASGRFIQWRNPLQGLPIDYQSARELVANGFGLPLYLTDLDGASELRDSFSEALTAYYHQLESFLETAREQIGDEGDFGFVINLLPLAHRVNLWMHQNPAQDGYVADLRVRPGGHINYRETAFQMAKLAAKSDPYLSALELSAERLPDASSREQFFDRS